ncbi:MAG TPA: hypothetical protein DCL15_12690 [Chloroflexi bacterium]|nr:hypothetical protein [Chloroflexota bacterium]HHW84757.1 hypothetical protein [Chloroflexota bacterium]
MDRTPPAAKSDEIELYIRTYYSLLRSSAPVRIRSLEETHMGMRSNLHHLADSPDLDISALVYSALRLPEQIVDTHLMVMGQMEDVFAREGYAIETWKPVRARARRRKYYYDAKSHTMAAFVASVSDIDDLVPCMSTFQIEWNKIHQKLSNGQIRERLLHHKDTDPAHSVDLLTAISDALDLTPGELGKLGQLWPGSRLITNMQKAVRHRMDLRMVVLGSGLGDYRRSVQHWWGKVEAAVPHLSLWERPIYFVSSNTHSIVNLITGLSWELQQEILEYVRRENPEDLLSELTTLPDDEGAHLQNFLYYASRLYLSSLPDQTQASALVAERERAAGVTRISDPHCLDVEAQIVELCRLDRKRLDPRLQGLSDEEWELLRESNAIILNIDYPLGMAAYHIFSQVSTAVGRIMGVYVLGKAATLNGRVGDVMIPNVVYDEHSQNTFLFRNCFTATDVSTLLNFGTVFDNQKAVTVRGTILQNRSFMHVFYEEGYTDIEMEAGPYLSGIYEDVYPQRYPVNEIVNLFINVPYDIGLIHYASDTPISRRQTLLSKSMSYFGVDATYATSIAVLRRILSQEVTRMAKLKKGAGPLALPERR